ncbi:MAG: adenylate kinase [Anaerolineae bacterium]
MWHLVLAGPPGSGKSTQGQHLAEEWGLVSLSTGQMLRDEVARGTALGREAEPYMAHGQLVPPQLANDLMRETLAALKDRGFILDGYPRSIPQAKALDQILRDLGLRLDAAVLVDVSEETAVARLASRLVCVSCRAGYTDAEVAADQMTCRACGGQLVRRNDDDPAVVRERFKVYHAEMQPVLEHYGEQGLLVVVDGQGTQADVFERLKAALLARRPQGV